MELDGVGWSWMEWDGLLAAAGTHHSLLIAHHSSLITHSLIHYFTISLFPLPKHHRLVGDAFHMNCVQKLLNEFVA
jgi:hypothetical protein